MGSLCHEDDSLSSAAKSGRFSRLEHILGGKSKRGVNIPCEGGALAEESKVETPSTKTVNCIGVSTDETMLEALTNSCISDDAHPEDLGLEIAMKQLMEATHDALVNMKGEILRMQYDLERALMEIGVLQQREELLQQQFKGKAFELEKEFCKQIEDLRQTMILEFTMCKHESEQSMLGKLEELLDKMRDIQRNKGKGDGVMDCLLPDNKIALERIRESEERCHSSSNDLKAKMGDLKQSNEQRAALTEEVLQRISPKRLEQSVAVVRGWLQSPTPSESSSAAATGDRGKAWLCNVPMPTLVCSLKEEAKLFAIHHRPAFPPPLHSHPHPFQAPKAGAGEVQEESHTMFKENIATNCLLTKSGTVASCLQQRKDATPQKTAHEKRPALRILKPKNFKISDLLVSDSEEESVRL